METTTLTISVFKMQPMMTKGKNVYIFERELALLVALQGESIWKGGEGGGGDNWSID